MNAGYNNQLISYRKNGGKTFTNIAFPAGVWNYTYLNEHIQVNKEDDYPINVSFDDNF